MDTRTKKLLLDIDDASHVTREAVRDELQRIDNGEGVGFGAGRDSYHVCRDLGLLSRNRNGNTYVTKRGRGVLLALRGGRSSEELAHEVQ